MNETVVRRLETLRAEYQKGQERLESVRQQSAEIQQTLLRIEGAISVLQELLDSESAGADGSSSDAPAT